LFIVSSMRIDLPTRYTLQQVKMEIVDLYA